MGETDMEANRLSRRAFASAAIVPFSAVRGSAQNSAITVGLIGCGGRGTYDAKLLSQHVSGARLVAVADLFPEKTAGAKKATGAADAKVYQRDVELLEKSGVDAVIIATPVFLHPQHLEAAIKAGKHIYIEKPAGADVAGCLRLMKAADSADRKLNITFGFQQRYGAGYRKAKKLAESSEFGQVVMGHSYWVKNQLPSNRGRNTFPKTELEVMQQWHEWREYFGDYIVENNVHGVDILNWFLGGHPLKAVGSGGRTLAKVGNNTDHSYVTFDYANNVQGHLMGCMITPRWYREVKEMIFGTNEVLETHREFWRRYRGKSDVVEEKEPVVNGVVRDITIDSLTEFVQRVKEGRPENTAATAVDSTLTCIMGRMATDGRREVTWEQMLKSA
jgi:myo-inositol 2-dehydrogenase / D-chiro-inositol 1-dehydrogenase